MSNANNGFIDLRVSHGARSIGDDSVWPSFTDIMTVIVMIFLMALVIMMVRNFELDRQLVSSIIDRETGRAENRALQAKIAALETTTLDLRQSLDLSQGERDALQAKLLEELQRIEVLTADSVTREAQLADTIAARDRLSGESDALQVQLLEKLQRIESLTASEVRLSNQMAALSAQFDALKLRSAGEIETLSTTNLSLTEQLAEVAAQLRQVETLLRTEQQQRRELGLQVETQAQAHAAALALEFAAKQELLAQLQSAAQQSTARDAEARAQIDALNESIRRRQLENAALQKLADASGVKFRSLQEEYDALDAKYRTLARPARSPAGKYVASVWILKTGERHHFRLKEPAQSAPVDYTRDQLNLRLASLKEKRGGDLYTRIIIPDNSRLSHNEAWRLTEEILQAYDYYYQQ